MTGRSRQLRSHAEVSAPQQAPEATEVCPSCGAPATVTEYWSSSPSRPDVRILKRQTTCSKRPKRLSRFQRCKNILACPVIVEEIEQEVHTVSKEAANLNGIHEAETESATESATHRGRLPVDVRDRILELHARGTSVETIAEQTARSVKLIQKVIESATPATEDLCDIDNLVDALCRLPEEAIEDVVQLARLRREQMELKKRLEERLSRRKT